MSKGFEELLSFPTVFIYRIIADASGMIQDDCEKALCEVFDRIESSEKLPSKSGKFVRIHIAVTALDSPQIYKGYDALKDIQGIRMVF